MNRTARTIAAIGLATLAFQVTLIAGPKGTKPSKVTTTKPTTAPVMKSTSGHGSSKAHGGSQLTSTTSGSPTMSTTKPAKVDVKASKTTTKTAKADAKLAKSTAKADAKASKHSTKSGSTTTSDTTSGSTSGSTTDTNSGSGSTTSGTTTTTTTTTTAATSNPLADKISRNPKLAAKVASRLPADMTLAQASTGFRNQGQFLAAVNVSRNLGIDFVELQTAMTGQTVTADPKTNAITTKPTGDAPMSLGRAIQTLQPGADADAAVKTAQTQSTSMVQSTSTTTPTSTTSTSTTSTTTASKTKKKTR